MNKKTNEQGEMATDLKVPYISGVADKEVTWRWYYCVVTATQVIVSARLCQRTTRSNAEAVL